MTIGGTPVGNMVIKVDLDAVGVEKSMTGLQRQLRSSNKAMGAQLSAFDRGDKSAAKYGVMIEGLSNRHRIQARMVQEARANYDHMTRTYGENSVKAQQASQELNEQIARYQETGRELDNVTSEFQEFQRVQEIQNKGWYKAADSMEQWGGKLKTAGTAMDKTGKTLTRRVSMPLGIIAGAAIKVGSDFEAGMSKVQAISGASAKDMKLMEDQARDLGATTVFSASEAASGMEFLAMAGFETNEIMSAMPGLLDLAASSNMDLGRAADIASNIISGFAMEAEDAGRVADVLAKGASTANTDVEGLGDSMATVAPVAASLSIDLEDMAAATGKMADSGIQGSKAGRMLRQGLLRLSKPTGEAADLIDDLGINVFDAEGNMKSMDKVVAELEKGLKGQTKQQKAAALATLFGSESTAGWSALLEVGSDTLADYSNELKNSEGAAADMAETMQDNLQGSLKELKSMIEDLFIEMYQNLRPALESTIDGAKSLTNWFAELSPKTQENIIKFGALAFAMGPVLSITGKLTFGIGSLMQGAGSLTKTIGLSKGAGLLGAMGSLGPLAVGGVAVAGLAAVSVAVYNAVKESKDLEEVNLDVAKSLSDEAIELEKAADTFDKLSGKAKISNAELAELNDLNIRISESSNPGEIKELQKQYDALAEKSGLSKDELQNLFEANGLIIKQSPDVKQSISDQGNAFAESTKEVRNHIEAMYDLSLVELEGQVSAALENQVELQKQKNELQKEHSGLLDELQVKVDANKLSEEENKARQTEINKLLEDRTLSYEEAKPLQEELTALVDIENGDHAKAVEYMQEKINKKNESIENTEEDIRLNKEIISQASEIALKQVGINEEGEKGLVALDKAIAKNDEELAKLDKKLEANGQLTTKEQDRYDTLSATNEKQREARDYLHDELGIYKDLNSLANAKLDAADKETQKKIETWAKTADIKVEEGNIVKQLQDKNSEYDKSISKIEKEGKAQGLSKKEIDKQILELEGKRSINDKIIEQILRELGVWDQVKDSIDQGTKKEKEKGKATDETTGKSKKQGDQISNNNKKTDEGIKKEQERSREAGKDVDKTVNAQDRGSVARIDRLAQVTKNKRVNAKDHGTIDILNRRASATRSKRVNLTAGSSLSTLNRAASSPVTKTINFVGKGLSKLKFWAKGTPPGGHPEDGPAVVGDGGGRELITLPSGQSFLSPDTDTLLNLPKGTHVIPHRETERIMRSMPKYADGTNRWSSLFDFENVKNNEFMKLLALTSKDSESNIRVLDNTKSSTNKENGFVKDLLNATLEQNQILMQLLNKNQDLYMQERVVGSIMAPIVDEHLERDRIRREKFRG